MIDGAIQFTLMFGANSAASERVNPSIAPLAADIEHDMAFPFEPLQY